VAVGEPGVGAPSAAAALGEDDGDSARAFLGVRYEGEDDAAAPTVAARGGDEEALAGCLRLRAGERGSASVTVTAKHAGLVAVSSVVVVVLMLLSGTGGI
jgi:hypothetical protein